MKYEELGDKLVEFMQKRKIGISFAEINHFFEQQGVDYKGEQAISMPEHPSIIYWANWNEFAVNTFLYVLDKLEGKLEMKSCSHLTYIIDGLLPSMPVAKSIRDYKQDRWLPVVMEVLK